MHCVVVYMARKLIAVLVFFSVIFIESESYSEEYKNGHAVLYFLSWNTATRFSFSPIDLKRTWEFRYTESNNDRLLGLVNMLNSGGFPDQMRDAALDGRFLVEYYVNGKKQATYFANQFKLCWIEASTCRSIDSNFKQTVTQMFEKYGEKSWMRLRIEEGMKER